MGKTYEDSIKEIAAKTPYTWGKVHDTIVKFKKPLMLILTLMPRLPEPTKETCKFSNSHHLIDIRDRFFEHLDMPSRDKALRAMIDFIIVIYEYDPPYRRFMDWWMRELLELYEKGVWLETPDKHKRWWKE